MVLLYYEVSKLFQRERELQELRQRAEEKRGAEAIERRATRASYSRTGSTPATREPIRPNMVSSANLESQLTYYEEIYHKIKVKKKRTALLV